MAIVVQKVDNQFKSKSIREKSIQNFVIWIQATLEFLGNEWQFVESLY